MKLLKGMGVALALALLAMSGASAQDDKKEPIKVGILHSLSGTMAISEVSLRDVTLMAIDEINAQGGVLGRKVEAVIVDPASNWPLFAEKAKQLLVQDKVSVVFGCWTSVSRKSVLPVFEKENGILFYPVQYEGEECSRSVFYTGAAVNQQAGPAVDYLLSKEGGAKKKFYLLGTDYVYPRTTNKILRQQLIANGIPESNIEEEYTPFGHQDYQTIVRKVKAFAAGGGAAVVSTINGDSNVPFYKEFANQGLTSEKCPVVAFSVAEDELRGMDTSSLVGHLAATEMTSSEANRRYARAVRRVGFDSREATHFFDEHVEADAIHDVVCVHDLAGGLAEAEPELADSIVFGARALMLVEERLARHLLGAWEAEGSSLRAPLDTVAALVT